jgi:nucleotide-binding universal stress UspA family protein
MNDAPSKLIVHPTDRTAASADAFAHALRIAVATKSELHVLHIEDEGESESWNPFDEARALLTKWRMIDAGVSQDAIFKRLGIKVVKASLRAEDPVSGIVGYVEPRGFDLMVMATRSRPAYQRWLEGSVAETAARETHAPALFLHEGQKGFVDRETGALSLNVTLMPIEATVSPLPAFRRVADLAHTLDPAAEILAMHVGEERPLFEGLLPHIELRQGPVVETILAYAEEVRADLIAMPTREERGMFEELLGGTTEHVLHASRYPVFAIPVRESARS